MLVLCTASSRCFSTRERLSAVAARVKVMARISSGSLTEASSLRKRRVSRSVLPEPAGARTMKEVPSSRARARSAMSRTEGVCVSVIGGLRFVFFQQCRAFGYAAQSGQRAIFAGAAAFLGIDQCFAAEKIVRQVQERFAPLVAHPI